MTQKYIAEIVPLNAIKIGTAEFTETTDSLDIKIKVFDTPANTEHWAYFHGFPGRQDAVIATEAVFGTTMVPFDGTPHEMNIPNDTYPVSDANGHFAYEKHVPLDALKKPVQTGIWHR